ncbi:amino acid adenylation domain-containing protein [Streptomyces sp. NPDC002559]
MPDSDNDGLLVGRLFGTTAARYPDRVAVVAGAESLTYARLDAAADRLAGQLRRAGVGPDVPVAVLFDRERVTSVVAAVAVWKAGGCYLPLDPGVPVARNRRMIAADGPAVLVGGPESLAPFADLVATCPDTGTEPPSGPDAADGPAPQGTTPHDVTPEHLAYIVHTSGSTGEPKAVAVPHRALATIHRAWADCYDLTDRPRVCLQAAGPAFDVHVADLVRALLSGGRLVLCPTRILLDPPALAALIEAEAVDTIEFTPAVLRLFVAGLDRPLPSLRLIAAGGERWSVEDYRAVRSALGERVRVVNSYGVAEAAIDSTWCEVTEEVLVAANGSVPIGRPFPGVVTAVVDGDGNEVGEDATGELWLSGPTLARGYHRNPEATAERFPFRRGRRWYRTGDVVRRADGMLVHLGRGDDEVKVRGVRGSLSGVEAVLSAHPAVAGAVVLHEERAGESVLVAHVLADPGSLGAVRSRAAGVLPPALVPDLVAHRRFPLTASGKVDRPALAAAAAAGLTVTARDAVERTVIELWTRHLGRGPRDRAENLFEAGGSSLTAALLAAALRDATGAAVSTATVFAAPTPAGLVRALADAGTAASSPRRGAGDTGPLSPDQRRLWLLHKLRPDDAAYHLPTLLRIRGPVRLDLLRRALDHLVARHDAFRTAFADTPDGPVARILPPTGMAYELIEASGGTAVDAFVARPFDLARGEVVRAAVLRGAAAGQVDLLLVAHHAVYDGWSERVVVEELGTVYDALAAGTEPDLPALPVRRLDVSRWQAERLEGEVRADRRSYWRDRLADAPGPLALPTRRGAPGTGRAGVVRAPLSEDRMRAVAAVAAAARTTPNAVLLAVFAALLGRWSGHSDLVVGVPYGDRDLPATQRLAGFEVATLPVRLTIGTDEGFDTLLERTAQALVEAIAHGDLPYDEIVGAARRPGSGTAPLFRTWFNWLGPPLTPPTLRELTVEVLDPPVPGALFDLAAYVTTDGPGARIDFVHDAGLFEPATVEAFAEQFTTLLDGLCADPARPPADHHLGRTRTVAELPGDAPDLLARLARIAEEEPDREAVRAPERNIGYRRLYAEAAAVSRALTPGSVVGVLTDRTADLVPALLGILGAGAAFTVLDAAHPASRLAAQLAAADAKTGLAVGRRVPPELASSGVRWLEVAPPGDTPTGEAPDPPRWPVAPTEPGAPAYVAFTSGTTGEPRGVVGGLEPLAHFLDWYTTRHRIGRDDRTALLSGLAHDPLLREILVPLWAGAALSVPPPELLRSPRELRDWLATEGVTVLHATPALCRLLAVPRGAPALRRIRLLCCSGDTLTAADLAAIRSWAPDAAVVHGYGATETPQLVSARVLEPGQPVDDPIAIDPGAPGAEVLVLDRRGRPAGTGELGDVVVRGPHLALAVLGDPAALTPDPVTGHRRFATGDLGRRTADGRIVLAGRRDEQAKVRGVRVEPAEIDHWLRTLPDVADGACAIRPDRDGEARVTAYLVPSPGRPAPTQEAVRAGLRSRLPEAMLPARVMVLEAVPLTPNGKIDRAGLPEPPPGRRRLPVRPGDGSERMVAGLWQAVLGTEEVPADRNFFDLGASSLQIAQVHQRLQETLGRPVPIATLFAHTTVRDLAAHLDGAGGPSAPAPRREPAVSTTDLRLRRLAARGSASAKEKRI